MMLSLSAAARVMGVDRETALRRIVERGVALQERPGGGPRRVRYEVSLSELRRAFPDIADECNQLRMTIDVFRRELRTAIERIEMLEAAQQSAYIRNG